MKDVIRQLHQILPASQVLEQVPMSRYTTFQVGGNADCMACPHDANELIAVLRLLRETDTPHVVIGRGSNLLVSDSGIRGCVVRIADGFDALSVRGNTIRALAGASLRSVALLAIRSGLAGLEFAGGIPGCVGGGVIMNAGAYDGELKDYITAVTVLDADLQPQTLRADEITFRYRGSSIGDAGQIVLAAEFTLPTGDPDAGMEKLNSFTALRTGKQPLNYPSAGSTFKRPTGYYAGALIEQCGLKGCAIGGAQVSEKHAGFVVNAGGACANDIHRLICHIRQIVQQETGITLECEVKLLGFE